MRMEDQWKKIKYIVNLVLDANKDEDSEQAEFILLKDLHKQSFRLHKKEDNEKEEDEKEEEEDQIKS